MGSFGERLRRERELRGVSLDEIVASTKIGRRLLQALEDEQFDLLPGGIFNKSYVRAYAKCVGIDEDGAVADYLQAAQETPPDTKVIADQHVSFHTDRLPDRGSFPILPVLILLVVAAGAVGGWKAYQDHRREQRGIAATNGVNQPPSSNSVADSTNSAATTNRTAEVNASSMAASPSAPPALASATASDGSVGTPFEVTVSFKDPAWVSIKADGKYVTRGIIKPPDSKTIRATSQVVFYTGNAGAVTVAFNGKNIPLSGGLNAEQVVVFDSRGVMTTPAAR